MGGAKCSCCGCPGKNKKGCSCTGGRSHTCMKLHQPQQQPQHLPQHQPQHLPQHQPQHQPSTSSSGTEYFDISSPRAEGSTFINRFWFSPDFALPDAKLIEMAASWAECHQIVYTNVVDKSWPD
eukprot:6251045-Amphidinium_carterae.1